MARIEIFRCSVIKYRRRDYVLTCWGRTRKNQTTPRKEVYILIIAKNNIKQYKPI
ncbi:MAG: hypothetical protein QXM97_06480 [Zestosphaera sp.]